VIVPPVDVTVGQVSVGGLRQQGTGQETLVAEAVGVDGGRNDRGGVTVLGAVGVFVAFDQGRTAGDRLNQPPARSRHCGRKGHPRIHGPVRAQGCQLIDGESIGNSDPTYDVSQQSADLCARRGGPLSTGAGRAHLGAKSPGHPHGDTLTRVGRSTVRVPAARAGRQPDSAVANHQVWGWVWMVMSRSPREDSQLRRRGGVLIRSMGAPKCGRLASSGRCRVTIS